LTIRRSDIPLSKSDLDSIGEIWIQSRPLKIQSRPSNYKICTCGFIGYISVDGEKTLNSSADRKGKQRVG
jgi:hypothetical protein